MKVYISGSYKEANSIRQFMFQIEQLGHLNVLDWTQETGSDAPDKLSSWAVRDMAGVVYCELYIGLFDKYHSDGGAIAELGMALALHKQVWIAGYDISKCVFFHHPSIRKFNNREEVLQELKQSLQKPILPI
jgi:nucleoside 2-deoxyribosyltransferase